LEAGLDFAKPNRNKNMMWVEKYRPTSLDTVLSHTDIINTIKRLVQQRKLPHLLFYGPPGTGKTTTMLAAARELNGDKYQNMTLELNASDARGIDVIRNQIKTFASTKQIFAKGYKVIILDEADSMTKTAQFALRRVIEQYTSNTRFCIICNYVNRITPAVQSRCTRFRFGPLKNEDILDRLRQIAEWERVNVGEEALDAVILLAEGDMRKCLNVLQACHMAYDEVTVANVYLCTGKPLPDDIDKIMDMMMNSPMRECVEYCNRYAYEHGMALLDILLALSEKVRSFDLHDATYCFLYDQLAQLEKRLARAHNPKLQFSSLVGIFKKAWILQKKSDDSTNSKGAPMEGDDL